MTRLTPFGWLAVAVGFGLLGWFGGWRSRASEPGPVRYDTVTVTKAQIEKGRPMPEAIPLPKKLTTRDVKPEQVAIAPRAVLPDVRTYCADFAARQLRTARTDTRVQVDTVRLPPAVLPPVAGKAGPGHLTLWLPLSDGSEWRGDYRVGRHYEWAASGDSLVVHSRRGDWITTWGGRLLWMGVGAAAGAVLQ